MKHSVLRRRIAPIGLLAASAVALTVVWIEYRPSTDASTEGPALADSSSSPATAKTRSASAAMPPLRFDDRLPVVAEPTPAAVDVAADEPAGDAGIDAATARRFTEADSAPARPLDLDMPAESTLAQVDDGFDVGRGAERKTSAEAGLSALQFNAESAETRLAEEPTKLFNPEYGLRGFMGRNWVSRRVAVQGGLALNDDRVIKTDSELRDDIAVGMGLILAF